MTDPRESEPFSADGPTAGPTDRERNGCGLSHGVTGTPASLQQCAEHLAAAGYTVRLPLLPGHSGDWRLANNSR